ncbi:MAG TPA: RDD family protein [Pyrinomonadaceae bacterium]|nr:RDD family protein [Pyrinomonadaceae bacterium]
MTSAAITSDDTLVIETPERVPLHFALASIGNRFIACAIDHTIQIIVLITMAIVFLIISNAADIGSRLTNAPKWVIALLVVIQFIIINGYFAIFEWLWSGQTPGKRWLKLRVIREDGRPISFYEAMIRNLIRVIDFMVPPFYSVGLVSVFATSRDQRVGDLVAGTVVVRERESEAPAFAEVFSSPILDAALRRSFPPVKFVADVNKLTEREISVVESFLRRRWELKNYPRQWMAWRVSMPILFKLRPQYDLATFTYEGFLEELLHQYREKHRFID